MVFNIVGHAYSEGLSSIPCIYPVLKIGTCVTGVTLLKRFFGGATNKSDRLMHSKVVMVTVWSFVLPMSINSH